MRKLLWGGVALLVLGATCVYIAADKAAKHPNSFLGRYANGAVTFALTGNPFAAAQQLQKCGIVAVQGEVAKGPGDPAEVAKPVLVPPQEDNSDNDSEEAQQEVREPAQVIQVPPSCDLESLGKCGSYSGICPSMVDRSPSSEDNADTEQRDGTGQVLPGSNPGDFEAYSDFVMAPMIEEKPPVMPEVVDDVDEVEESSVPTIRLGEEEFGIELGMQPFTRSSAISNCEDSSSWIPRMIVESQDEQPKASTEETSEPTTPVANEETNEPKETSNSSWLIRLLGLEKMFEPTPEPMTEIEPTPTGTEMQEEVPQRDPDYHRYHYQGCPYSGCPYPYSRPVPQPETPPVAEPTPMPEEQSETKTPTKHKKHTCNSSHQSFWQQIFTSLEEARIQPAVDTMECRPTDVPQFDLRRLMPF